ncbi:EamA family transporter [Candidatus Amarobacter glycogenicus]|uniref:EamA family transporter n=1 Tax=Candidatus Amarobacter glycogenicus TaxID=3140699 RepID=UPI003135CEC2|nr:EamA family transporter [Dehalococcoidia bacterium]
MGILLGLGAAFSWGTSDFLGGRFTRKYPAFTVGLVSQSSSLLALLLVAAIVRPEVRAEAIAWGLAAGVFTSFGGMALYQGLATGESAVVAPLSACGAVVPVAFAFATGHAPSGLQDAGIALALAGTVLVSLPPEGARFTSSHHLRPVLFGLGAAIGFGVFFILVDRGTQTDGDAIVVIAAARFGGTVFVGGSGLLTRSLVWPGRGSAEARRRRPYRCHRERRLRLGK